MDEVSGERDNSQRDCTTMNKLQQAKCVERLSGGNRSEFLRMQHRAAELIQQGVEMRKAAWELYRQCTGLPLGKRRKKEAAQ
jgi:hypothetical protein